MACLGHASNDRRATKSLAELVFLAILASLPMRYIISPGNTAGHHRCAHLEESNPGQMSLHHVLDRLGHEPVQVDALVLKKAHMSFTKRAKKAWSAFSIASHLWRKLLHN